MHGPDEPHLVLAGPDVFAVDDDPEGAEVLEETEAAWRELPPRVRRRVHLALLPMDDADENAVIVNALQRRADVVVQKSLAEGFGLTVSEAMWKARPVVATTSAASATRSRTASPAGWSSRATCARSASRSAPCSTTRTARSASARRLRPGCATDFLGPRHLGQYVELLDAVLSAQADSSSAANY